jgi:hypothetical protein
MAKPARTGDRIEPTVAERCKPQADAIVLLPSSIHAGIAHPGGGLFCVDAMTAFDII